MMTPKQEAALRLAQRITDYLAGGGLNNPELADHGAVRDLLIDCREALAEPKEKYQYGTPLLDAMTGKTEQPAQQDHWQEEARRYAQNAEFWRGKYEAATAQQQEPVVWMYINRITHETSFQKQMRSFVDHSQWKEVPLYSEPLANHEFQCVCGAVWCGDEMVHLPDKRPQPSKPLTDEQIMEMYNEPRSDAEMIAFARAIEAAHGIGEQK